MRDDYDILLGRNNVTILQQIIGTDTATMSEEEILYYHPRMELDELEQSLNDLIERGYLERISRDSADGLPRTFYSATQKAKDDLQEVNLWEEIGIIYQLIGAVEKTERIREIEEVKPEGELVSD